MSMMGNVWISKDDSAPISPWVTLLLPKSSNSRKIKNNRRVIIDKTTKQCYNIPIPGRNSPVKKEHCREAEQPSHDSGGPGVFVDLYVLADVRQRDDPDPDRHL